MARPTSPVILVSLCLVAAMAVDCAAQGTVEQFGLTALRGKTAIDLTLEGTFGVDYAIEPVYSDPAVDAHVVLYLTDAVRISMAHDENNVRHSEGRNIPFDGGTIALRIDGDYAGNNPYGSLAAKPGLYVYDTLGPWRLSDLEFEAGTPVVGTIGTMGDPLGTDGKPNPDFYLRGLVGPDGDEWHTLIIWDRDPPPARGHYYHSDGKTTQMVVNPQAPAMVLSAPAGDQFYSTPAKTYGVARIHAPHQLRHQWRARSATPSDRRRDGHRPDVRRHAAPEPDPRIARSAHARRAPHQRVAAASANDTRRTATGRATHATIEPQPST